MILSCQTSVRIVTKYANTASNGKTYFHVGVVAPDGTLGELGCTAEVFNEVIENKSYYAHFNLNTTYLRKDFNCSFTIDAIQDMADDKSIKKGA